MMHQRALARACASAGDRANARSTRTQRTRVRAGASTRAFDPRDARALQKLGARENLLDAIARKDDARARDGVLECEKLSVGENFAVDSRLYGRWRLIWSEQAKDSNPLQRALGGVFANYQTFERPTGVRNTVELGPVTIEARARSEAVGETRTNVWIDEVDVRVGGRTLKTFTLAPRPGAGQGWVEQLFLDDRVRISRGNKGSVFVHVRDDGEVANAASETTTDAPTSTTSLARVDSRADEN